MIIMLDLQSDIPIYMQLRHKIIEGIASKQLRPGDPLPSVRSLAQDLGINMHTVNKAYQLLKQDGYIHIHRQKGVIVNPDGMPGADDAFVSLLKERLRPLISEAICRGVREEEIMNYCQEIIKDIYKGGEQS